MGDLAANAAMVFAKDAKPHFPNPRQLAAEIATALAQSEDLAEVEVAGPGFINIRLKPTVYRDVLRGVLCAPDDFGRHAPSASDGTGHSRTGTLLGKVNVELCGRIQPGRCMWVTGAARCSATLWRICWNFPAAR